MAGIKETQEVLVAANEVAILMVKLLKDGVQLDDFAKVFELLVSDEKFKAKIAAAYDQVKMVPEELSDLGFFEAIELGRMQLTYVPKFVEAMKT